MSRFMSQKPIILASGSSIRFKLLSSLGLEFLTIPSDCDEAIIKNSFKGQEVVELGYLLAQHKALDVSQRYPNHYVIAADQLCVVENRILDKPLTHQTAIEHLTLLSGKKHQQIACLCIAKANQILWQHHDTAQLTLDHLSHSTIEAYLHTEKPYHSCGAYQYETQGKWLFKEVQGNEDTILGLPLLSLTKALIELRIVYF